MCFAAVNGVRMGLEARRGAYSTMAAVSKRAHTPRSYVCVKVCMYMCL